MRWALLIALPACGEILGISTPKPVTGRHYVLAARNNTNGEAILVEEPFVASSAALVQDDGSESQLALDSSTGAYSVNASLPYRIAFDTDSGAVEYQGDAAHVDLPDVRAGRYPTQSTPANTTLDIALTNPPTSGTPLIQTTGVWVSSAPTGGTSSQPTLDWSQSTGLLDADEHDEVFVTVDTAMSRYRALSSSCRGSVTLAPGTATHMQCTLSPVTTDRCAHIDARVGDELVRLQNAVANESFPTAAAGWRILSAPAGEVRVAIPVLAVGTDSTNTDVVVSYANPFPGHRPFVELFTQATNGADGTIVRTSHTIALADDCMTATRVETHAAIPGEPTLDDNPIHDDGTSVVHDASGLHRLSWTVIDGDFDYFIATLTDLVDRRQRRYVATSPTVAIEPGVLEPGRSYVIGIVVVSGVPHATAGDFRTVDPNVSYGIAGRTSGSFLAAP